MGCWAIETSSSPGKNFGLGTQHLLAKNGSWSRFAGVALSATLLGVTPAAAQTKMFDVEGTSTSQQLGRRAAAMGDVDGDGHRDFAVLTFRDAGTAKQRVDIVSGSTGALIRSAHAPNGFDESFGSALCGIGDQDGDVVPDLLVGAEGGTIPTAPLCAVYLVSGGTGAVTLLANAPKNDRFGYALVALGDLDLNGVEDFAVGANQGVTSGSSGIGPGYVTVYSGGPASPLTVLGTVQGSKLGDDFGQALAAGDTNADGVLDLIVGADQQDTYDIPNLADGAGYVRLLSLAALPGFTVLKSFPGSVNADRMGFAVAGPGDTDGDGFDDIVGGAFGADPAGSLSGQVRLWSGSSHALLKTWSGSLANDNLGYSVAGAGDWNGDGLPDVIAGAPQRWSGNTGGGYARVYSGASPFGLIQTLTNPGPNTDWFGDVVVRLFDLDQDGHEEVGVGNQVADIGGVTDAGRFSVFASTRLALSTDGHTLSLATGGTQTLTLDAPAYPGQAYLLFGSASGTSPGLKYGSVVFPLNYDPYLLLSIAYANSGAWGNTQGVLDPNGKATATLTLPAGLPPSLAGLTLHHAFAVFQPYPKAVFASNAVPIVLE